MCLYRPENTATDRASTPKVLKLVLLALTYSVLFYCQSQFSDFHSSIFQALVSRERQLCVKSEVSVILLCEESSSRIQIMTLAKSAKIPDFIQMYKYSFYNTT